LRVKIDSDITEMNASFAQLRQWLVNIAIFVLVGGALIAVFTSRSIVRPVNSLRRKVLSLGQGIYSVHPVKAGNDEIGDMADAVSKLIKNFERTKEFSIQLGAGNFDQPFTPLSEHDELGMALLQMRKDLASYRNEMEKKVDEQTQEIRLQKEQVEQQREKVMALYTDLQASIRYAQRLQQSVLPSDDYIHQLFPDSFVFFRPKATVSGDFYWFRQQAGKKIFAAADCTGHGVPGAFMSLVGHNVLNQVTKVFTRPAQILNGLNRIASEVIKKQTDGDYTRDGMDVAMCALDPETLTLEFSGAHNPMYLVRNGELQIFESDPYPIGSFEHGEKEFKNHLISLQPGDCIYLFSDGYSDQFGGPKGKKFLRKQFKETLLRIHNFPMEEQKWRLAETLDRWQGDLEQVDDILVIGVRV
jgi:serine phosphatase RsbU (regulator of sigma subunit)